MPSAILFQRFRNDEPRCPCNRKTHRPGGCRRRMPSDGGFPAARDGRSAGVGPAFLTKIWRYSDSLFIINVLVLIWMGFNKGIIKCT